MHFSGLKGLLQLRPPRGSAPSADACHAALTVGWLEAVAPRRLARAPPVATLWCMAEDIGETALEEPGRFVRHFLQTFMVIAPLSDL